MGRTVGGGISADAKPDRWGHFARGRKRSSGGEHFHADQEMGRTEWRRGTPETEGSEEKDWCEPEEGREMTYKVTRKQRTIVDASLQGSQIAVRFADGKVVSVQLNRLVPGIASKTVRNVRAHASHIEIAAGGRTFEIGWSTIRRIVDAGLDEQFSKTAKQERYAAGLRLADLRRQKGLTARTVARKAGLSPQSLSRIENGRHDLVLSTIERILGAMDSSMEEFIDEAESNGGTGTSDPPTSEHVAPSAEVDRDRDQHSAMNRGECVTASPQSSPRQDEAAMFPWRRFWYPRETEPALDTDGFLVDPEQEWVKYSSPSLYHSTETFDDRCVIFLGDPSSGKSKTVGPDGIDRPEFEKQISTKGGLFVWLDLREYDSSHDFQSAFSNHPSVKAWRSSPQHQLFLFLDSLDECRVSIPAISNVLIRELRAVDFERLMLRIVCRTADWPTHLELELQKLYRQELRVLQLAPLRECDVEMAAQVLGVDAKRFLARLKELNAVPFARKPPTLLYLLQAFSQGQPLPKTQWDLYEQACRLSCEEYNQSRIAARKTPTHTPDQLLEVASRVGALTVFTNRPQISHEATIGFQKSGTLRAEELVGGEEKAGTTPFAVTVNAVAETLHTSLFAATGPGTLRWETRNIAEYLAARFVLGHSLELQQVLNLLVHPRDKQRRFVPQLHNTAAWIAEKSDDVFNYIAEREPEILLSLDVSSLNDERKRTIVSNLVKNAPQSAFHLQFGTRWRYARLHFRGIADLLRKALNDTSARMESRIVAADVALSCGVADLADDAASLALEYASPKQLRVLAALIVAHHGSSRARGSMRTLLEDGTVAGWEDDEMLGAVLLALWPDHLSFSELLPIKTPPKRPGMTGLYSRFIRDHIVDKLPAEELGEALEWVARHPGTEHLWEPDRECMAKLIVKALQRIGEPEIRGQLGRIAYTRLRAYEDLLPPTSSRFREFYSTIANSDDVRHALLSEVLDRIEDPERDWVRLLSARNRLLQSSDFKWVVKLGQTTTSQRVRIACSYLAPRLVKFTPEDMDVLFSAAGSWPELRESSAFALGPIDLGSQLARDLRDAYRFEVQQSENKPTRDVVADALKAIDTFLARGTINDWIEIAQVLDSTGTETQPDSATLVPLTRTRAWSALSLTARNTCLMTARNYLQSGDPHNEEWFTTRSWPYYAVAGYQALVLLFQLEPSFIDGLTPELWERWLPVLLTFMREGTRVEASELVALACQANREAFLRLLLMRTRAEAKDTQYVFVLENVEHIWDSEIDRALVHMVANDDLQPTAFRSVLDYLVRHNSSGGITLGLEIIKEYAANRRDRDKAAAAAEILVERDPGTAWELLWRTFVADEDFGKQVIEQATYHRFGNVALTSVLDEAQLGQLFRWLLRQYPLRDIERGGGAVSGHFTAERFRDAVLMRLASYGSYESLEVLKSLQTALPEFPWPYYLTQADVRAREATWDPPTCSQILDLARRAESRLVNSGDDLLVVLHEALKRIQLRLHSETPAVEELWNYTPIVRRRELKQSVGHRKGTSPRLYAPKDEPHLSDWLKRRLEDEIVASGIVIGREVEIRRNIVARGERTDIYVAAIKPGGKEKIVVVIEVKGCWNPDLKTAMQTQLVERYLKQNLYGHGIYLVGWFSCNQWSSNDYRLAQVPFRSISRAKEYLEKQAEALSNDRIHVSAMLLDAGLR